jgi:hypothetical protein
MLALLLTAFVSLLSHLNRMLYGSVPDRMRRIEQRDWPVLALAVPAVVLVVLGLTLPAPLSTLIYRSVASLVP